MGESQDVAERVLWKSRDQKEDEGNDPALVLEEVVIFPDCRWPDDSLDEGQSEVARQDKGEPGSDGQADCRIDGSQKRSVKIPSDYPCDIAGQGGHDHLDDLECDEDDNRQGAVGRQELGQSLPVQEEGVDVEMHNEKNPDGHDQRDDENPGK